MILLIDNYDSFSYNLVQAIGTIVSKTEKQEEIKVIRNDELTIEEIERLNPSAIILSPGPGRPKDAGVCEEVVDYFKDKKKILGVCLGHQGICEVFGAEITYAKQLMHGKQSKVTINKDSMLFQGLENQILVARYHSLAANPSTIPTSLEVLAYTDDSEVMAVKAKEYEVYGLQFHPESVLTPDGQRILENFLTY